MAMDNFHGAYVDNHILCSFIQLSLLSTIVLLFVLSMKILSNLDNSFLKFDAETAVKQNFPYPSSIMYYIKNVQKSFRFYYKFVKLCKYFYSPNDPVPYFIRRIVYAQGLNANKEKLHMRLFDRSYVISVKHFEKIERIWLRGYFTIESDTFPLPFYSSLLKNLYLCDISILRINGEKVSFSDFKVLTTSRRLQELSISPGNSIIYDNNDSEVPIDEILKCLPNITTFRFGSPHKCTTESVKKCFKVLNPSKIQYFGLTNIIKPFDFETFSVFMKKNPKILYEVTFATDYPLNNEYTQKLQNFVNEIIAAGETENPTPQISFQGLSQRNRNILRNLLKKYKSRYPAINRGFAF